MQIQTHTQQSGQSYFGAQKPATKHNFSSSDHSRFGEEPRTAPRRFVTENPQIQSVQTLNNAINQPSLYRGDPNFQSSLQAPDDMSDNVESTPQTRTEDAYTFGDVIDVINPLHHIPLVNALYRGISGDEIKPTSQIIGSAIFGGPVGAASAVVNVVVEHETGTDITGNALSLVSGNGITRTNHNGNTPSFDYSENFADAPRTAIGLSSAENTTPNTLYNFNRAESAYNARIDYAARYNS